MAALSNKLGRDKMAATLGYADTNYLNQVATGHTKLGNGNARKWEAKLRLNPGDLDRPITTQIGSDSDTEIQEPIDVEFEGLVAAVSDTGQLEALTKIADQLSPKDAIRLARYLLIRAEAAL